MFKATVLILILALSSVHGFWSSCPGFPGPSAITSPACSGATCTLQQGSRVVFASTITFARAHSHLLTRLTVFVGGVGTNIPLSPPHNDACNSLFLGGSAASCPTTPNVAYRYDLTLDISTATPAGPATARFELVENGVVEVCADINVTITA